jgi:hypothetical protein
VDVVVMGSAPDALAPVKVEDWVLFAGGADFWVRDLDLAERAGLAQPRKIRELITKAIDEGPLLLVGAAHDGSGLGEPAATPSSGSASPMIPEPRVRVEKTHQSGSVAK